MSKLFTDQIKIIVGTETLSVKATATGFDLYRTDGTTGADLFIGTINLQGGQITFLSQQSGTPTLDAALVVERGSSTNTEIRWNETLDTWTIGLVGAGRAITRRVTTTLTNANLSAGLFTVAHGLGVYPQVTVLDNSLNQIGMTVNHIDANNVSVNFNNVLVSGSLVGTWTVIVEA